ncbi:MAG: hypothetical protein O2894_11785 [Planctomycetota bacterium]|nr:hypothetical protein [Planctomycetota bacterium]
MTSPRRLFSLSTAWPRAGLSLAAALLGLVLAASPALAVDLAGAQQDLEQLKKATKASATNDDVRGYLDAVFNAYKNLAGPEKPAEGASEDEVKAWESENAKFEKARDDYRDDAEKLFLKVLTLVKVENETNIRDDVNIRAATILGELGPVLEEKARESLSRSIIKEIERKLTKVKTHEVNSEVLASAFAALGHLNDPDSLEWMLKNHCHANEVQKDYIIAAHRALVLFTNIEGKIRYEVVSTFVKVYGGVELQAEKSSNKAADLAKKRFWDDIKTHTIPVVQHFAGKPTTAEGSALATMEEFTEFMREHKNVRKAPWEDVEVGK